VWRRPGSATARIGPEGPGGADGPHAAAAWHDGRVTDQGERYDRIAAGYARWWAPVLAPGVDELLDEVGPRLDGAERLIDIGTGTGQLALAALERWPGTTVLGIDASAEMRAMADAEADRRLADRDRARFSSIVAFADSVPVPDATFDAAVSSFVFQLVPNRSRALREARRTLRPGGLLAYVSWLDGDPVGEFLPDAIFDEVLDELDFGPPDRDDRTGDIPSVERAAAELRRAGFGDVTARAGILAHRFTVDGYLGFLTEFDEESMFAELEPALRERVVTTLRARLAPLTAEQMTMRAHIVVASGRRSR
jgi:SAM-dependent methyltransferase